MKIIPTLEGGLCLHIEQSGEWALLHAIANDAIQRDNSLASELGTMITDPELNRDWREFVLPDLELRFSADLKHITDAIHQAEKRAGGEAGRLWITPEDATAWYSALNQARLAIEARFRFGETEPADPGSLPLPTLSALIRSRNYCMIQELILDHILG